MLGTEAPAWFRLYAAPTASVAESRRKSGQAHQRMDSLGGSFDVEENPVSRGIADQLIGAVRRH